ncbi:hypothetical protein M9H77_13506 [Catharanthus roseus]|uniref:Uncharacterized protein n=1 Tax=Catharanthus roseus TaxID=4058 RepID=A0ACC0BKK9_CATRO|nr:hypothetical protein M9H77_13506 [Catharanthus roseus]
MTYGSIDSHTAGSVDSGTAGFPLPLYTDQDLPTQMQIPSRFDTPGSSFAPTIQALSSTLLLRMLQLRSYYIHLQQPPPISQLSCRNGSLALITICLRSRWMSATCGGENFRHAWDVKFGDRTKYLFGDARVMRKMPVWFPEMFWEQMMKYWESSKASIEEDLTERFSKIRHFEELHKHQTGDKKGQCLQLMAIISGGLNRGRSYGVGSEAAHFRAENNQVTLLFESREKDHETGAAISSVYTTFGEHRRRFAEESHLPYTLMPPMIDIITIAMAIVPSTSSSTAAVGGT